MSDNDLMMKECWDKAPNAMGVYELDEGQLKIVYLNDRYYEMIGADRAERKQYLNGALNGVHPDDRDMISEAIRNAMSDGSDIDVRARILGGDGEYRWYGIKASYDKTVTPVRLYASYYDVSELMEAEEVAKSKVEELKKTREMHDFALEGTDVFVWQYDLVKDEITFGSNPYTIKRKAQIGYPDVVPNASKYIMANVMPESIETMQGVFDDIMAGKEYTSGDIHFRAGGDEGYTVCRISYRTVTDETGKPVKAYGSELNITDRVIAYKGYEKELARFETEDKTVLFRTHSSLTRNKVLGAGPIPMKVEDLGTYDDAVVKNVARDVVTADGRKLSDLLGRGTAIAAYAEGERHTTVEYQWPGYESWKWVRAEIVLVQNPNNSDIEIFLYCYDDTQDRLQEMILERLSVTVFDHLAVINAADGTYMMQSADGSIETNDARPYSERCDNLIANKVPEEYREETREAFKFENILGGIADNKIYSINTVEEEDGQLHHKMRRFFRLDDDGRLLLVTVTDVTDTVKSQLDMMEQIESDTKILQQASLDAYDFIAVIDCETEMITLRGGSWFSTDVPTPEEMRSLPYEKLLAYIGRNYSIDSEEGKVFFNKFAIPSIARELETQSAVFFPFDFLDATNKTRIKYKQFRFSWLDEEKTRILAVRSDVTTAMEKEKENNMRMKDALNAAEAANSAKSEFLSRMSHDIRTPMNAIIGFSTLLLKNPDDPDKVRDQSRKILSSSNHLLGLINDVLDMSKIETGEIQMNLREFKLSETIGMIDEIMRPQMEGKGQTFDIYVSGVRHDAFVADEQRLQQILINILSNATKYTADDGRIALRIASLPERSGKFENISFEIEDNGRGMTEEYQKIIFEPFSREQLAEQNDVSGTGLGMAITRNLVNMMGGTIEVKSELGVGSTFKIVIPMQLPSEFEDPKFWVSHSLTHMLVVDDEEVVCQNVMDSMEGTGVRMEYALDGITSIGMLEAAHNKSDDFDVVLLDWKMPDMDGVETARQIRKNLPPEVLIIILTAYDFSEIEEEARAAGIDGFMPKPFFVESFEKAICDIERLDIKEEHRTVKQITTPGREEADITGLKILAAEDNELNAEILAEILRLNGAGVSIEPNGQDLVDKFKSAPAGQYNLILMDIQMPVMDGYEATRTVRAFADDETLPEDKRAEAAEIPIIAMTANAFSDDVSKSLASGMNAHVAKPLDISVLKRVIADLT